MPPNFHRRLRTSSRMFMIDFDSIGRNFDQYEIRSYRSQIECKPHGIDRVGPPTCRKRSPEM